jgi:glycosidase
MQPHWSHDAVFYHLYPLGFCGAPARNDLSSAPVPRLDKIHGWLDHLQGLGVNALYLGPLFESTAHGYDTADYFHVDRRLGTRETLAGLSAEMHRRGMRLILDGVFNHVGRDFWAFRDVREKGQGSAYCGWFAGLDFGKRSSYGDPFSYQTWNGCYDLVKLEHRNPAVREHLLEAVRSWIRDFDIDGLRLDVADALDLDFQKALSRFCRDLKPDFWLMGEVIHGDYRRWVNPEVLDSVTNYECYKGLFSSLNDRNYFEIAYALDRQFGPNGLYRGKPLYAFADNHDVDRVASRLKDPAMLFPLYALLFTMPGVPSIYYGSEWGIRGQRTKTSDAELRPTLDLDQSMREAPVPGLPAAITKLAHLRLSMPALRQGDYRQLHVGPEQFAFLREAPGARAIVVLSSAATPAALELRVPFRDGTRLEDRLNPGESFEVRGGKARLDPLHPRWARVLEVREP